MATITTSSDFAASKALRPGLLSRFYAAFVEARMREAEHVVRRARNSMRERGVVDAEFLGALPSPEPLKPRRGL